jgi:hypothetical protein
MRSSECARPRERNRESNCEGKGITSANDRESPAGHKIDFARLCSAGSTDAESEGAGLNRLSKTIEYGCACLSRWAAAPRRRMGTF